MHSGNLETQDTYCKHRNAFIPFSGVHVTDKYRRYHLHLKKVQVMLLLLAPSKP